MKLIIILAALVFVVSAQNPTEKGPQPAYGSPFDEVVVQSSLNVRKKPSQNRQTRSVDLLSDFGDIILVVPQGRLYRQKRQFSGRRPGFGGNGFGGNGFGNGQDYGSSSALAGAHSMGQHFGQQGFGSSAGIASGQAFESHGPLGGFGAAAANSQTQGFEVGPDGFHGGAGISGSQSYNLPTGQTLSLTYGNTYSVGPDGKPAVSQANAVGFS